VRYSPEPWGIAVDVQISGLAAGRTCQLWVTDAHGAHLAAAGGMHAPRLALSMA
jgi:hypothetical protein